MTIIIPMFFVGKIIVTFSFVILAEEFRDGNLSSVHSVMIFRMASGDDEKVPYFSGFTDTLKMNPPVLRVGSNHEE